MEELLELIGEDALTRLCVVFGGVKLYVSNSEQLRQRLEIVVGVEAATKIIDGYRGETLEIPNLKNLVTEKRKRNILAARESMTVRELALSYGLTERHIRNILNNNSAPDPDKESTHKTTYQE